MTIGQFTSAQPANLAGIAKLVDAVRPIVDAIQKIVARVAEAAARSVELIADRLAPSIATLAQAVRTLSPGALELARCMYETLLVFLEKVPGAQPIVHVLRHELDTLFYSTCRRLHTSLALVVSAQPSLATSPRYLVSRSSRRLRGPSLALCAQAQVQGASLT